ncbi:hypothetical protein ACO0QE_004019 [Hanseniaspora vineae]
MNIHTVANAQSLSTQWLTDNLLNFQAIPEEDEQTLITVLSSFNQIVSTNIVNQCFRILRDWDRFYNNDMKTTKRCLSIYNAINPTLPNNNKNSIFRLQRPISDKNNLTIEEIEVTKFLEEYSLNSIIDIDCVPFSKEYLSKYNPIRIMKEYENFGVLITDNEDSEVELDEKGKTATTLNAFVEYSHESYNSDDQDDESGNSRVKLSFPLATAISNHKSNSRKKKNKNKRKKRRTSRH